MIDEIDVAKITRKNDRRTYAAAALQALLISGRPYRDAVADAFKIADAMIKEGDK